MADYLRRNVLGLVAIFIALTAGAYAVQKAPKNSVVSKSIKNGQVKNKDLAANSVDSSKVIDNALTGADIDESSLQGVTGSPGSPGPPGEPGPTYAALPGGGLTLNGSNEFSVQDGGITSAHIADGTLRADDLAANVSTGTDLGTVADGDCIGGTVDDVLAPAGLGDPVITATGDPLVAGVVFDARMIGPGDVLFQVCNFTGSTYDPPNTSYGVVAIPFE